jgi:hypothetical protein
MSSIDTPQSQPADLCLVSPGSIQQITVVLPDILLCPESWMGDEHDLVMGQLILDVFIAYIAHLVENSRALSTLKKHANYLWALGGEIIRDTSEAGFDKCKPSYDFVLGYVDNLGGPYWRHASSEEDRLRYDSVCRALNRFLKNK